MNNFKCIWGSLITKLSFRQTSHPWKTHRPVQEPESTHICRFVFPCAKKAIIQATNGATPSDSRAAEKRIKRRPEFGNQECWISSRAQTGRQLAVTWKESLQVTRTGAHPSATHPAPPKQTALSLLQEDPFLQLLTNSIKY